MAGHMRCVLAVCVLGALLLASPAAAEQKDEPQTLSTDVHPPAFLSNRRALRLVVDAAYGWWFDDTLAQTKVTLVPAKSFHHKPAEEEEKEKEEKQKSTAHLKNVDLPAWYKDKTGAIDGESGALYPVQEEVKTVEVVSEDEPEKAPVEVKVVEVAKAGR